MVIAIVMKSTFTNDHIFKLKRDIFYLPTKPLYNTAVSRQALHHLLF